MQKIAILDFGSQLTHLLATQVRRLGVYSEILDSNTKANELTDYIGIILSGGPSSIYEENAPQIDPAIFNLQVPILGICYGHQLIVKHFGGKVESAEIKEYGKADLQIIDNQGILKEFTLNSNTQVWMSHGDDAVLLPPNLSRLASTPNCANACIGDPLKNIYSVQFHLEVVHTIDGLKMLKNFLDICKANYSWNLSDFLDQILVNLRQQIGSKKVFLMISGGVDSTVAFALLAKAINPEHIYALLVDTGFMRQNEVSTVKSSLEAIGVNNLHVYNAEQLYLDKLEGVDDPELKRTIIGDLFLDIQQQVSDDLNLNPEEWLLAQGTIYPDTIESGGTKNSHKIKTHHNRVFRIEELIRQNKIIEPVKDLYKDEVRQIGELLGLPHDMINRHPFPGPGLAVRTLCTGKNFNEQDFTLETQQINQFLSEKYPTINIKAHISSLLSVGVQGDGRTYRHPVVLEAEEQLISQNFDLLLTISTALTNKFTFINRVILKISNLNNQIITIKTLKEKFLTKNRLNLLRQADHLFTTLLKESNHYASIWQAPVVLLPINATYNDSLPNNHENQESLLIRPISSNEAMTADVYPLPFNIIEQYAQATNSLNISTLFYDLTHKPPGTIEWE